MALFSTVDGAARRRNDGLVNSPSNRRATDIRGHIDNWTDPYLRPEEQPTRPSVCEACGAVYANHRWYEPQDAPSLPQGMASLPRVLCPADRRLRDRSPGGLVSMSGTFLERHWREVQDLVLSEERRARADNPMERILAWHWESTVTVETSNPKLAQKIGRRLLRSFRGRVNYLWGRDEHMVRVSWLRDA